jgi:gliding motility-associated-like protein
LHQNKKDFWIVTQLFNTPGLHSYLLTDNGLDLSPTYSHTDSVVADSGHTLGCMKVSQAGDKIALVVTDANYVELFNFDNATGLLTNPMRFYGYGTGYYGIYGIEFSPDGKLLYVSLWQPADVYQLNLEAGSSLAIEQSKTLIGSAFSVNSGGGSLQLAPDNKIYMARIFTNYLSVINSPNTLGLGCGFNGNAVYLGSKKSNAGLPNFNNATFRSKEEAVIDMPNVFTPNNDKSNDFFIPLGVQQASDVSFVIYNIWGSVVYESTDIIMGWDGTFKGQKCPEGVYYYIVTYNTNSVSKGFLTLIR